MAVTESVEDSMVAAREKVLMVDMTEVMEVMGVIEERVMVERGEEVTVVVKVEEAMVESEEGVAVRAAGTETWEVMETEVMEVMEVMEVHVVETEAKASRIRPC